MFFFFKQKTAYEIYQCDWSSDVCSSDLAGNRIYRQKDIDLLRQIKYLLYDKGYTIEGARNYLKAEGKNNGDKLKSEIAIKLLGEIRAEIDSLLKLFP